MSPTRGWSLGALWNGRDHADPEIFGDVDSDVVRKQPAVRHAKRQLAAPDLRDVHLVAYPPDMV